MHDSTPKGLGLVGVSALLGVLGDAILRVKWGVNFPLWLVVAVASAWALRGDKPAYRISGWPVATALLFALFIALRDSEFLRFWNTLAIMGALSLPLLETRRIRLNVASVWDYAMAGPRAAFLTMRGFLVPVIPHLAWGEMSRFRKSVGPGAIGTALSIPVLFVFGGLLLSADSGFAGVFGDLFKIDYEIAFGHVMATGVLTWLSAGYLASLLGEPRPIASQWGVARPQLGIIEIGLPLGTVALVFVAFLMMQVNYLFGGEAAMRAAGLSYAEYAREGFIQLVVAATLVIPLLLGADWLFDKKAKHLRVHRILATTLLILVGLLMLSAAHRIALYVGQYGLSEIRLYASVFMLWIGSVNVIFLATILRGREAPFAFGSLVSGIAILAALNVSNPEAIIARSQFQKASQGTELDVEYLSGLSADAVPVIMGELAGLGRQEICVLWLGGIGQWAVPANTDWRSWNLARSRAERVAREYQVPDLSACESAGVSSPKGSGLESLAGD